MFKIFLTLILFFSSVYSIEISSDTKDMHILPLARVLVCTNDKDIDVIRKSKEFKKQGSRHINLGFSPKSTVWIELKFKNIDAQKLFRVVKVDNPLLEEVTFYSSKDGYLPHIRGMLHAKKNLYPVFVLDFQPKEKIEVYIKVKNRTTGLQFGLDLLKQSNLDRADRSEQLFI